VFLTIQNKHTTWPTHPCLCLCSEWWRSLWHARWSPGWRGCCPAGWL